MNQAGAPGEQSNRTGLAVVALGALGVVYGDLGTSPLYALQQCFGGVHSVAPTPENVLGVMSLVFWAINFVISFKYITFVMRADNRGEGGVLSLLALLTPARPGAPKRWLLIALGLFGAALLYGDGVITPAISVLSAVEGIQVATPAFERFVVPLAVIILIGLFWFQRRGTGRVGAFFGPIMLVWFACITLLGIRGIAMAPGVLRAAAPWYAVEFFLRDRLQGFLILGAVVLVVTGGEALYADMGHFGKRPIRLAWFSVVLPALLINYFGQSALLLVHPEAAVNPFFNLVPSWGLYPMVAIATIAAVVASQALISGAFSLTRQAIQLGFSPRMTVVHTSSLEIGQIYLPEVNKALGVTCIALVLGFQSSGNLAAAYGLSETGAMIMTTLLFYRVARERFHWGQAQSLILAGLFLIVDLSFFSANLVKLLEGGWFPLLLAAVIYTLMTTWKRGREILAGIVRENTLPIDLFLADIREQRPHRVPGTAVFMTSDPEGAPPVLLHHLKHNKVLHEKVILMSVVTEEVPHIPASERVTCAEIGEGFYQVIARYGFMQSPNVPAVLRMLGDPDRGEAVQVNVTQTSFYLGRETLLTTGASRMARWRKRLFAIMTRNAQSATAFFNLPPNRVVELGAQIQF